MKRTCSIPESKLGKTTVTVTKNVAKVEDLKIHPLKERDYSVSGFLFGKTHQHFSSDICNLIVSYLTQHFFVIPFVSKMWRDLVLCQKFRQYHTEPKDVNDDEVEIIYLHENYFYSVWQNKFLSASRLIVDVWPLTKNEEKIIFLTFVSVEGNMPLLFWIHENILNFDNEFFSSKMYILRPALFRAIQNNDTETLLKFENLKFYNNLCLDKHIITAALFTNDIVVCDYIILKRKSLILQQQTIADDYNNEHDFYYRQVHSFINGALDMSNTEIVKYYSKIADELIPHCKNKDFLATAQDEILLHKLFTQKGIYGVSVQLQEGNQ